MLAHRVAIQAPQPWLRSGTKVARRQPSANRTRAQSADFETLSGEPDRMHQQPGTARKGVQSLISYQAEGISEDTTD